MNVASVKCPNCSTDNPQDHRFCKKCGNSLVTKCPNPKCNAENTINYKFCGVCGTPLQRASQSPPPPQAPPVSSPPQTTSGIGGFVIPPQYESRLKSLLDKGDKLVAWYSINYDFERGEKATSESGNGIAITREKIIFFSSGCLSGVDVKIAQRYSRSIQEVYWGLGKSLEIWTTFGKCLIHPKSPAQKDELIRLLSG